jgi:hypothetical protein
MEVRDSSWEDIMDVSGIAAEQALQQQAFATTMVKKNAQSEQAVANMIDQSAKNGQRLLDILV